MVADGNRRGYSALLDEFWTEAALAEIDLPQPKPVSAAAFCKARAKLPHSLLRDLLSSVHQRVERDFSREHLWQGRRVFAIDGSKFNVKDTEDLDRALGRPHRGQRPQMLVCTLFDVLADIPVASVEFPYATCERESLDRLLEYLRPGDLLILDSGYPSFEVFHKLEMRGIDFLIRIPSSFRSLAVTRQDRWVTYFPPADDPLWREVPPLELRVLRSEVGGTERYFVTTLSKDDVSHKELTGLYEQRWRVEEHYKALKNKTLGQDMFRSTTEFGVVQELLLCMLFTAIARYIAISAAAASGRRHDPELRDSLRRAVAAVRTVLAVLTLTRDARWKRTRIEKLLESLNQARYRHRPGRSYPRRSTRPHPKWDAGGRRGG